MVRRDIAPIELKTTFNSTLFSFPTESVSIYFSSSIHLGKPETYLFSYLYFIIIRIVFKWIINVYF